MFFSVRGYSHGQNFLSHSCAPLLVPWLVCAKVVVTAAETAAWNATKFIFGGGDGGGGAVVFLRMFVVNISCYETGIAMSL